MTHNGLVAELRHQVVMLEKDFGRTICANIYLTKQVAELSKKYGEQVMGYSATHKKYGNLHFVIQEGIKYNKLVILNNMVSLKKGKEIIPLENVVYK